MNINKNIEAVVTSYNQGSMILDAVRSLYCQTTPPARIVIVDDGSTDENSVFILNQIESDSDIPIPVTILYQSNSGVSAARNTGIQHTHAPMVLVLDGDDKLKPSYIEEVSKILSNDSSMLAASSWMHTFGVLDAVICPCGGSIGAFLSRNCCPASHILRREVWVQCGGYDVTMRSGFEDWDFFLSMLETMPGAHIGIVEKPLIDYRTAPASSNIKSMSKRLDLMRFLIEKHRDSYREHIEDAILGLESISMERLYGWENEILHTISARQNLSKTSNDFVKSPTYGDGGMAAAVRIASSQKMVLETKRLYLRNIEQSDFDSLCKILKDEETMYAYEGAFNDTEVQEWLDRQIFRYHTYGFGLWAVILKENHEMIGQCGLTMQPWKDQELLEIGYLFQRSYWHNGYATEAAQACKQYAFSVLNVDEVCSIIRNTNTASQKVALRNDMVMADTWTKRYRGVDMPHNRYVARKMQ